MMDDAIRNFPKQFEFKPTIALGSRKKSYETIIVAGMGGSHLAADVLKSAHPELPLVVHSDYGLPSILAAKRGKTLFIASSYSGNTEETISALFEARKQKIDSAALAVGGTLLARAREYRIPFVQLPDTGIQPRSALGFSLLGLVALLNLSRAAKELAELSTTLDAHGLEGQGKRLARRLKGRVPVIYASNRNAAVAYNWKIKLNETGKIPAFYNAFPELNHNEMTGFDVVRSTRALSHPFSFVLLRDASDHARVQQRMDVLERLYRERRLPVVPLVLAGSNRWHAIFSSLVLADWTAYHTARLYGAEPEQVPMVESFKKLL